MNELISLYLRDNSFIEHNINSFNNFIDYYLQKIVDSQGFIDPDIIPPHLKTFRIKLGKIWLGKPQFREADGSITYLTPFEARMRKLTYAAPIYLEMIKVENGRETDKEEVLFGYLPVLVKSKYCNLHGKTREELIKAGEDPSDPGGYFIVNGTEKVVVIIEDLAQNKLFVEKSSGAYPWTGKIYSQGEKNKIPHLFELGKDGIIYVTFARAKRVPLVTLIKALGVMKDNEIVNLISNEEVYSSDIFINLFVSKETNEEELIESISQKVGFGGSYKNKKEKVYNLLDRFLLPHIGNDPKDRKYKAYSLGKYAKKLLAISYGLWSSDDKDHYSNKRLRLVGDSMATLFKYFFTMMVGDIKYNFERLVKRGKYPSLQGVVRSQLFTTRIKSALATGEWIGDRTGVSQHLERLNFSATMSHLRRVTSLLSASRENFEARDLHPTHWGKLCTTETPEGPNIGLRKSLAITSEITEGSNVNDKEIINNLKDIGIRVIE